MEIPVTFGEMDAFLLELAKKYPFLQQKVLTKTKYNRPVRLLRFGYGKRKLLLSAAWHGNEWITAPVLLRFAEDFAQALTVDGTVGGVPARVLESSCTWYLAPLVNPDGVALVTGEAGQAQYEKARQLSAAYPAIPFPTGWKANGNGVDLNLQFPAGWLQAREIKFSQGYTRPGPRDYVGVFPLQEPEARAMADLTAEFQPDAVIAFHTQGQVIYWEFGEYEVPGGERLGEKLASASGYGLEDTPYNSSFAGFKDWFIKAFRRPGYTVEAGLGENPLPMEQFPEIYEACLPLIVTAAVG